MLVSLRRHHRMIVADLVVGDIETKLQNSTLNVTHTHRLSIDCAWFCTHNFLSFRSYIRSLNDYSLLWALRFVFVYHSTHRNPCGVVWILRNWNVHTILTHRPKCNIFRLLGFSVIQEINEQDSGRLWIVPEKINFAVGKAHHTRSSSFDSILIWQNVYHINCLVASRIDSAERNTFPTKLKRDVDVICFETKRILFMTIYQIILHTLTSLKPTYSHTHTVLDI